MRPATPPAEVEIDEALLRSLLRSQHPDLADLPMRMHEAGWDNVMVRLGEDFALRLPRRRVAEELILKEQRWLPVLGPELPIPTPIPMRVGVPDETYPFHWSVLPWLPGEAADRSPPAGEEAPRLADFLLALHRSPPADAPVNPTRGAALAVQQKNIAERIDDLEELGEPPPTRLRTLWEESFLLAPPSATTWIEADLHARNVLVDGGRISAIIDWGDLCAGDPSTDLAAFWMLFDSAEDREAGLVRYGATEEERSRAAGWAILFGVLLLHTGLQDTPRHAAMGRATLARVLEDR